MSKSSRRGKILFVLSWLLTRLWWGFEMSRLAILRARPRIIKQRVSRTQDPLPASTWLLTRNMFFCLSVDDGNTRMVITQTPPIEMN